MITTAWVIGLATAALGWLFWVFVFVIGALTFGLGGILGFLPLVGIILSIVGLTNSQEGTIERTRSLQALLMCVTGLFIGWFAFLFLLIRTHRNQSA